MWRSANAGSGNRDRVRQYRPEVTYHLVDLAQTSAPGAGTGGKLAAPDYAGGSPAAKLEILPRTTFTIDRVTDAFRFMMQAKHIGKIVVVHGAPEGRARRRQKTPLHQALRQSPCDGTALI